MVTIDALNVPTDLGVFAVGERVELVMAARRSAVLHSGVVGVIESVEDDGWIIWREDDGAMHATRPASLRKQRPRR